MKNLNSAAKIFLYLSILSSSVWIGSYLVKIFTIYRIFEEENLNIKEIFSVTDQSGLFYVLVPVVATSFTVYLIFFFSLLLFLVTAKLNFKIHGWLFISVVIFLITLPFEAYLMTIDYKFLSAVLAENYSPDYLFGVLKSRITMFSSFPIIQIFSYFGIIYLILFKPLSKSENHNEN
jgi:hypothetical protein